MTIQRLNRIGSLAALAALYVLLYRLSDQIAGNEALGFAASIFFLPAFVRLLGFLIAGFQIIPALFGAALLCVDLGLGFSDRFTVSAFLAIGGPCGAYLASRWCGLTPDLVNLTPLRLLAVSVGCAAGNAISYELGLTVVGLAGGGYGRIITILAGDALGTWAIIYVLKFALNLMGRSLKA